MTPKGKRNIWLTIALAIAAAIVAFVTTLMGGCAIAIDGRLATWAATADKKPPDLPTWAPVRDGQPATRPADSR